MIVSLFITYSLPDVDVEDSAGKVCRNGQLDGEVDSRLLRLFLSAQLDIVCLRFEHGTPWLRDSSQRSNRFDRHTALQLQDNF